jgi:hypothetical protein
MSKNEAQKKELQAILSKEIGAKNPIFSNQHIEELHNLFSLYADPRQRRADIKDLLMTAKTLGLDERYDIVFRVLVEVSEGAGEAVTFEDFLKSLTARIVICNFMFREALSPKKPEVPTSVFMTCKEKVSSPSMSLDTSTNNSDMDLATNNSKTSFSQLEATTPRLSLLKSSANTSKRDLTTESNKYD